MSELCYFLICLEPFKTCFFCACLLVIVQVIILLPVPSVSDIERWQRTNAADTCSDDDAEIQPRRKRRSCRPSVWYAMWYVYAFYCLSNCARNILNGFILCTIYVVFLRACSFIRVWPVRPWVRQSSYVVKKFRTRSDRSDPNKKTGPKCKVCRLGDK